MQKNGEIRAKIGVDTADILILWPSAKIKMKVQTFVLENLHPGLRRCGRVLHLVQIRMCRQCPRGRMSTGAPPDSLQLGAQQWMACQLIHSLLLSKGFPQQHAPATIAW